MDKTDSKQTTAIKQMCQRLETTLLAKNADYGNSAFTPPPFVCATVEEGIAVRFGDKVKRLETLLWSKSGNFESIDDTLLDIAGYAILWLVERKRKI